MKVFSATVRGSAHRLFDSPDLGIYELRYPAGFVLPRHSHADAMFCYSMAGSYEERIGSRSFSAARGSVMYEPPGHVHQNVVGDGGLCALRVEATPAWLRDVAGAADRPPHLEAGGTAALLAHALAREVRRPDGFLPSAVQHLAILVLIEVTRADAAIRDASPAWLRRVRECLEARLDNPPTVPELAAEASVHPSCLARQWRRSFGCTVGEFVRDTRLKRAWDRVMHSNDSLADIAARFGFADQSHLGREFKRRFGEAPGRARRHSIACGPSR